MDTDNGLVLEERLIDAKSNEIKAAVSVLNHLDVRGCVITADALNEQTKFAQKIPEHSAG